MNIYEAIAYYGLNATTTEKLCISVYTVYKLGMDPKEEMITKRPLSELKAIIENRGWLDNSELFGVFELIKRMNKMFTKYGTIV